MKADGKRQDVTSFLLLVKARQVLKPEELAKLQVSARLLLTEIASVRLHPRKLTRVNVVQRLASRVHVYTGCITYAISAFVCVHVCHSNCMK